MASRGLAACALHLYNAPERARYQQVSTSSTARVSHLGLPPAFILGATVHLARRRVCERWAVDTRE